MHRLAALGAAVLLGVLMCAAPADAVVIYYKASSGGELTLPASQTSPRELARYGFYSTLTAPNWGSCHRCQAKAVSHLKLARSNPSTKEVVWVILRPSPPLPHLVCGVDDSIEVPTPHGTGSMLVGRSPAGVLMQFVFAVGQNETDTLVTSPSTAGINELELLASAQDGIYYLHIFSCAQQAITVSGHVELRNPYGDVSADLFPLIPWYMTMSLCFGFVASIWTVFNVLRHEHILPLQWVLSGVLVICLMESAGWFITYQYWNDSGSLSNGLVMLCILLSASKWSISRGLILAVSMGWSIVRSSLGTDMYKIGIATLAYFVFSSAFKTSSLNDSLQPEFYEQPSIIVVLGMSVLDALFYWWTVMNLLRTISALTVRRQALKVALYSKLFYILVVSLILSALVMGGHLMATWIATMDDLWRVWWFFDTASYSVVYMFVLVSMAIVFRPSPDNTVFIATPESEGTELRSADDAAATPELMLSPMGITLDEEDLEDRAGKVE